ncbi:MAG: DUF1902 domain-containing protein [Bryobacterales bacterium]|nr:DUF1902 domain-containing protein [Bryobacterales bacterium]
MALRIVSEELPEGLVVATPDEFRGLIAQGCPVAEAPDIARVVARKFIEARREREGIATHPAANKRRDYTLVIAA